jgi:hypothetical protein
MEHPLIRIDKNIAHNIDLFINIDSVSNENKGLIKKFNLLLLFFKTNRFIWIRNVGSKAIRNSLKLQ